MKKLFSALLLLISFAGFAQMTHETDTSSVETTTSLEVADLFTYEIPNHSIGYAEIIVLAKDHNDSVIIQKRYTTWAGYDLLSSGSLITAISSADNAGYSVIFGTVNDSILKVSVNAPTIAKTMKWQCLVNIYYNNSVLAEVIPPSGGNSLNLSDDLNEYIQRSTDIVLSGPFSIDITCQDLVQNGTYIPLFGGSTTANRLLLDAGQSKVALNIGGSALTIKSVPGLDAVAKNKYTLYRNSSNGIYFQVDSETPVFMLTSSNNLTIRYIGKASSAFKITGVVHEFNINTEQTKLVEGSGTTLLSESALSTWNIHSDGNLTHVNEVVWSVAPPESLAIQVINSGIGGNNSLQMKNRFDADVLPHNPDMVWILPGTNDILNSATSAHQTPAQFKANLLNMVDKTIAAGAIPVIWNLLPCIDSICKVNHDYASFYGPENTYDLTDSIMNGLYLPVILEVQAAYPSCIIFDVQSVITNFTTGQASMIKNPANTIPGNLDGVHLTGPGVNTINNGRLLIATAMADICDGYSKIVLLGDSNIAMGGSTSIAVYLSLELND